MDTRGHRAPDFVSSSGQMASGTKGDEDALGLDSESRRRVQQRLTSAGFGTRGIDGIFGPRTRAAISDWQRTRGYSVTGFLNAAQLSELDPEILARR
jgi:peptidoglycan hydrolase-like protein with peptidoglycan-binding domain